MASESAGITTDWSQYPGAQTRNHPPDLSSWTGIGAEWVEKPSDQESWVEVAWEGPSPNTALGHLSQWGLLGS